ncbi:hypothetical protein [Acinetobacter bouvetii]|uniref:Uncharacterized protein n=1 Tax=Acinetobacter bouvetii TaxID=202951 RepID=A0A811GCV7_9GAMM|nr:hypothetical protein [Acinetobacter bouvetii]CAB1219029.1 hypothetical protein SFB21_2347 [Acinetobacter bouvetii]
MELWCLKILFFLFATLSMVAFSFGFYIHDGIIIAIGLLFVFATFIITLELKQLRSSPFQRD